MSGSGLIGTTLSLRHHLAQHPLNKGKVLQGLSRFFRYQLAWRMTGAPTVVNWIGGTRIIVGHGMRGVTGEVYMGVNEFEDVFFCAHFLRQGDFFVDCGANVGTYAIMAAKVARARVLAIEPILSTVSHLEDHIRLNRVEDLIEIAAVGVSDKSGELWFTGDADALNEVTLDPGPNAVRVAVTTLDDLIGDRRPICIKIDVEKHEHEVIAGAVRTLAEPTLQAVLIEVTAEKRTDALLESFTKNGFLPYIYSPESRELTKIEGFHWHNTLFIRNTSFALDRLRSAPSIPMNGLNI